MQEVLNHLTLHLSFVAENLVFQAPDMEMLHIRLRHLGESFTLRNKIYHNRN